MFEKFRERRLGDFIPWVGPISDDVRLLSDHSVLAAFEVRGVAHETVDDDILLAAHNRLNLTWRNAASDSLIATVYQCRGDASPSDYPSGRFRSAFAESLDLAYRDGLYGRSLYDNRTFLFLQVRPGRPAGQWVGDKLDKRRPAARAEDAGDGGDLEEERVRRLNQACDLISADLAAYGLRRLGAVQRGRGMYCEMSEALAYAMTGVWRPVPYVLGHMGHAVLSEYAIFGRETIELRGPGRTEFAAMLAMQAYPAQYWPGQFDQLLAANYRYTAVHSIRWMSQAEGVAVLTRKQNYMVTAGDKAASQIAELDVAADQAQSGKFVMGDYNFALAVFADSVRSLRDVAKQAWQDLADAGVKVAREGLANQASYLSMVPGNAGLRVRPGAISSRAFSAFCPFHAYPAGPCEGYWGEPLMACRTRGGTLYRLHLHWAESGNVFVSGRTRSGKTTWMAFVIGQAEKYGARVVVADKDRGLELAVRAYGGSYARLRDGEPCVAPLKALDGSKPGDMTFLNRLSLGLIRHGNTYETTPEDERRLALGLRAVMALPPEDRWVEDVAAFLPQSDPKGAAPRLMRWAWGRELGWVIDGPKHLLDMSKPVIGFDQTDVLDNSDARGPILSTIFHVTEQLLDGRPVIWVLDEVWKSLLDEQFAPLIHDALKTRGKLNSPVILGTQSPKDALNSPIAHTIVEQCGSMAHFANPKAKVGGYGAGGLGMSDEKVQTIADLQPGSGYFLWEQGPDSTVLQMPLHGLDDEIAVLSGKQETVKLLDEMPAEVLADPARMLAAFHAARKHAVHIRHKEIVS